MPMNDSYHMKILRNKYNTMGISHRKYLLWKEHQYEANDIIFQTNSKNEFKMYLNLMFGDYKFRQYTKHRLIIKDTYSYNLTIA